MRSETAGGWSGPWLTNASWGAGRTRAATGVQWNSSIPDFFEDKGGRIEVLVKVRCRNRLSPVIML